MFIKEGKTHTQILFSADDLNTEAKEKLEKFLDDNPNINPCIEWWD